MRSTSAGDEHIVARIPVSMLRLERRLAPFNSYAPPDPNGLAPSIIEGKRELDRLTLNELSGVSDACRRAAPASQTDDGRYFISRSSALPLPPVLSHRALGGVHLWIGVEEGIAIVLDDNEHALFLQLRDGTTLSQLADTLRQSTPERDGWAVIYALIGRLAVSGFIRGIDGYTDRWLPSPGRFMRLHLTQRCNLTCVHCYADSSPYVTSEGEISVDRWSRLIDEFADAGGERVLFTGGEALIYKGCDLLIRKAHERALDVTLFSNGLLIDRYLDLIRACVDQVQISIDGPDAQTNDAIRGPGSFARAKQAVDTLIAAGVRVRISMVVMASNLAAMQRDFVRFASQWPRGAVEFRLGYGVAHHGRGEELGDPLGIDDVRPVVDALLEAVEGDGGPRIARSTKGCGYAEQIVVAHDGTVHPCHLLDGAVTHIDKQSIPDLIQLLQQTSHDYDVDHTVGCNRCDIRNLCGGTCRILNGKTTGNRRIANCTASDKLHRLHNLVETFSQTQTPQALAHEWE
ncbi:radical SAM/SPASM domain-containing protein [Burkholderia thailandensis]|uniref:radical SAM/SPASM domain-containing protein n=1 Tax=Burkholderia thailandensis TaxID=57975 RepID=UPI0002FB7968|nr:radical SAM protein [Burkholderia thailandensis]AHI66611.1 radical SAM additional 4Fe4S-binding SPASM domain protein [Burkholderia thailandensis H0587]AIP66562.1 radical SAM protein [Burkholderia thailandensis]AOI55192.1 radical SAM protein [Burkholderia thailandensis]AOJ54223.1 radical SAM protein [Burkholderia thailandensis]AVR27621.1 radical SAM protein [Burkholderia thailandensis]